MKTKNTNTETSLLALLQKEGLIAPTVALSEVRRNVERLMEEKPSLRNDDISLILAYWREIDGANVHITSDKPLTKPNTIIRRRQKIQADGELLPTSAKVRRKRGKPE